MNEVEKAITSADFFLTFISLNSVDPDIRSETGFSVNSEVAIAQKKLEQQTTESDLRPDPRSYFIPVRLDRVDPPASLAKLLSPVTNRLQVLNKSIKQFCRWIT